MATHYVYIPLPTAVKDELRQLQDALSDDVIKLNLRRINPDNAHLTLAVFKLNEDMKCKSTEELVGLMREILSNVMNKDSSFGIKMSGLGHFNGNVAFISVEKTEALQNLRSNVIDAMEEQGVISTETSRFNPHITLFKTRRRGVRGNEWRLESILSKVTTPNYDHLPFSELFFKKIRG